MNVYLPIINKTLVGNVAIGETNFYKRPIPVWPTRSYTITITPENPAKDVEISILQGGVNKFLKNIPYSPKIEFDFVPLLLGYCGKLFRQRQFDVRRN